MLSPVTPRPLLCVLTSIFARRFLLCLFRCPRQSRRPSTLSQPSPFRSVLPDPTPNLPAICQPAVLSGSHVIAQGPMRNNDSLCSKIKKIRRRVLPFVLPASSFGTRRKLRLFREAACPVPAFPHISSAFFAHRDRTVPLPPPSGRTVPAFNVPSFPPSRRSNSMNSSPPRIPVVTPRAAAHLPSFSLRTHPFGAQSIAT